MAKPGNIDPTAKPTATTGVTPAAVKGTMIRSKAEFEKVTGIKISDESWNTLQRLGAQPLLQENGTVKLVGSFLNKFDVRYTFYIKADDTSQIDLLKTTTYKAGEMRSFPITGANNAKFNDVPREENDGCVKLTIYKEDDQYIIKSYNINGSMDRIVLTPPEK